MIPEQKISYKEQVKIAYKFMDMLDDKLTDFPDYRPLTKQSSIYERNYMSTVYQRSYKGSGKEYKNVSTVQAKFLIERTLFGFNEYKEFMVSIENLFKDFKDVNFSIDPDVEHGQTYLVISIHIFYDKLTDENNASFRSLLGLDKFNL